MRIISIIFILCLVSCYDKKTIQRELTVRKSTLYKYEIEIPVKHKTRGNVHQFDLSEDEFTEFYWLYSDRIDSIVHSSELVLTTHRNQTKYPYCQSQLKGHVRFYNDSIELALKVPVYSDSDTIADSWTNYEHNGRYKLKKE